MWITTNWKILQEMGIPDSLTCLLRNLCAGQEATVRNGKGTTDWFQIGKGVHQDSILSPCLFNLYAEYTMQNARLDEAWAGIKIAGRNLNNFRYTDDATLMEKAKNKRASWWKGKRRVKMLSSIHQQIWKLSNGHRTGKGSFHSNPKERQCQRMFQLPHNCAHLTC